MPGVCNHKQGSPKGLTRWLNMGDCHMVSSCDCVAWSESCTAPLKRVSNIFSYDCFLRCSSHQYCLWESHTVTFKFHSTCKTCLAYQHNMQPLLRRRLLPITTMRRSFHDDSILHLLSSHHHSLYVTSSLSFLVHIDRQSQSISM